MSNGRRLGLKLGDRVRVMGGPDGEGNFASSAIWQILPDGKEIRVKDEPLRANAATYLIYRLLRLKENVLKKITGMKESKTQR